MFPTMNDLQFDHGQTALRLRLLSICAGVLFLLSGCQSESGGDASNTGLAQVENSPVTFVVSGDTQGWIVPCGCSAKQSGGLLRRGSVVQQWRGDRDVVVLDAGGAASGVSAYHRAKFLAILEGEMEMGLAAHNIGAAEARLGADSIGDYETKHGVPFVSANVFDDDGQRFAADRRFVQAGGRRFAVLGVLDPASKIDGVEIRDPRQSILDSLETIDQPVDGIIVLAYLQRDALMQLARQLPEVDVVVGGPTGQTVPPKRLGGDAGHLGNQQGQVCCSRRF